MNARLYQEETTMDPMDVVRVVLYSHLDTNHKYNALELAGCPIGNIEELCQTILDTVMLKYDYRITITCDSYAYTEHGILHYGMLYGSMLIEDNKRALEKLISVHEEVQAHLRELYLCS